jgi:DNA topoisomerase-2
MTKHISQTYKLLDEIDHIRQRPGMYAGDITPETKNIYVYTPEKKMELYEITAIPAFIKIFSEILDNAIDEHRRAPETLDTIRVDIHDDGSISVTDNGRGIPVEIHPDSGKYVATTVFSSLRAGSNFNDDEDQQLIGTNGVGSTLTNVLSSSFKIESCDGKKLLKQEFFNGMREWTEPKIKAHDKNYTKITFTPDYQYFKLDGMDDGHRLRITKKVVDAAATNPKVKFYVNGERIMIKDFSDYIALYADEYVYDDTTDWKVGISKSDGFEQISFVNSVETYQGGTHITYCINQIVDELRAIIKKKHKVDVSPGDIRTHMRIYISCNVNRPRFSSQTKENMISPASEWKTKWTVPDKFITKLLKTEIIQSILDWAAAKEQAELAKQLRGANKDLGKADPRKVNKFSDAMETVQRHKCVLFLAEGDSAAKSIQGGRGKNPYIGSFPLKGKPLNVREKDIMRVLGLDKKKEKEAAGKKAEPNEIQKILTIIGLQIGVPVRSLSELRFGKLAVASDADVDGFHICGLLMNIIDHFWPELFDMGFVHILRTPVILVTMKDKSELEFFTERDFREWAAGDGAKLKWSMKYYKGLSSWKTPQFATFLENLDKYLFKITMEEEEDKQAIDLAFNSQRADDRKVWLETPADDFEEFIVRI